MNIGLRMQQHFDDLGLHYLDLAPRMHPVSVAGQNIIFKL